jgi:hypothetical protein
MKTNTPAWFRTEAQLIQLLGNKLAVAAVHGRKLPVVELVYSRLTSGK